MVISLQADYFLIGLRVDPALDEDSENGNVTSKRARGKFSLPRLTSRPSVVTSSNAGAVLERCHRSRPIPFIKRWRLGFGGHSPWNGGAGLTLSNVLRRWLSAGRSRYTLGIVNPYRWPCASAPIRRIGFAGNESIESWASAVAGSAQEGTVRFGSNEGAAGRRLLPAIAVFGALSIVC